MSSDAPARPPRRRTGLLVGAGVVVAVLAGGIYAATNRDQPPPAPAATSPAPTTSLPVGAYAVEAGGGGSDLATDGKTPIGFADDCTGAAHAATAYYVAVLEGLYQDQLTPEEFDTLLDQINAGLDANSGPIRDLKAQFRTIREEAQELDIEFHDPEFHPEWGAFRVHSCADRASATVEIVGFAQDSDGEGANYSYESPRTVRVSWFEDDWRLLDLAEMAENPASGVIPLDSLAPLPADQRRALIAANGPGWTEYTNAP
ncbi:hypothetical protein [Actinotalea sp. K2]|uniref:hypothetical protein n=1 Tax=Actinotalea sp. K2 TaxID=2939438 RepID=UPI002016D8E6|nr:hypothetical protein [Actinotalea sp. K2]MCL3863027.1 hypothetical protein [Actinotalea sp. K2]